MLPLTLATARRSARRAMLGLASRMQSAMRPVGTLLPETLLPESCVLCERGAAPSFGLCAACHAALPWNHHACPRCGLPLGTPHPLCGACFARPPPFVRTIAPLLYRDPVPSLVQRMKFGGGLVEARVLGAVLTEAVAAGYASDEVPMTIVPVPLSTLRLLRRGHNQAMLLAAPIARALRVPVAHDLCVRTRHTRAQAGLARSHRQRNVSGAFAVMTRPPRRVAIVDDVMTTGATLRALARALRSAGAEEIHVWVAARTAGALTAAAASSL